MNNTKKIIVAVVFIIAACLVIGEYFFSDNLVGKWEIDDSVEIYSLSYDYPEDDFVIYKNGTFTADNGSGEYSFDKSHITFSGGFESYSYEYQVQGNVLALKSMKYPEDGWIKYYRAEYYKQ